METDINVHTEDWEGGRMVDGVVTGELNQVKQASEEI